jgi:hypothetical protein
MKVQHQILIREQARHKFAPLGDMVGGGTMNTGRDTVQTSQFSLMGDNDSIAGGVNLPGMHTTHMPPTSFPSNVQFASAPLSTGQAALLTAINPKQPVPPSGLPLIAAVGSAPVPAAAAAAAAAGAAAGGGPAPALGGSGSSLVLQDMDNASLAGGASIATASTRHTAQPPSGPRPDHAQLAPSSGGGDAAGDAGSNGSGQGQRKVRHPTMLQAQSRAGPELGDANKGLKKKTYDKDTGILSNKFDDHEHAAAVQAKETPARFGLVIASVAVLNCRAVHMMSKNNLQVTLECGRHSFSTEVLQGAGESGQWASLNWSMPQVDGTAIGGVSLTVSSGKTVVGHMDLSADTLYQKSLSEAEGAVVKHFDEMKDGPTFCGKIRLNYVVAD